MEAINFKFTKIRDVKSPTRGTTCSAGLDFYIPNDYDESRLSIKPHGDIFIASGIKVDMMCQPVAFIGFNKSGIAVKHHLIVGACVVDSDYQGEIFIHLINTSDKEIKLSAGMKIVQLVAVPVYYPNMIETDMLFETKTERGEGKLGSTNEKE